MKRLIVLTGMVMLVAAVTSCSSNHVGQPEPATTNTATSAPSAGQDPTSSGNNSGVITDISDANACSLLTTTEAASVGLPDPGTTDNANAKSGCQWAGPNYIAVVVIRTNAGLADVAANGGTITDTRVGSHQAKQLTEGAGSCLYAIGINDSTRVDVNAGPIANSNSDCQESLAIAQLVEKHLP